MPRKLANWLRSYAEYTSNSEAPDVFNFWTGVSTIAGALRRQVWIDEVKFKWYPNFYIIFVAPPGVVAKSTTSGVGMKLLRQIEGINMGPASMTWQGLTYALQSAIKLVPFNYDANGVALDYIPMSAITCEVSELGTFLDAKDEVLSSVLIDLWDGKDEAWERWLRSNDNTRIENPWVNILASTTPSWLRGNFPESMIGGGLTSRIIFVYADTKKRLIPYISRVTKPSAYKQLEETLLHDLEEIARLKGQFVLSDEAYEYGAEWYEKHWTEPDEHLAGDRFQGYRARKQTHIHKLAIVLAAAESDNLVIEKHHLELSTRLITGVEGDMHKVFESIGLNTSAKFVHEMLSFLRTYGELPRRDLWRHCMKFMSPKEFGEATDAAVGAGYVVIKPSAEGAIYVYTKTDEKPRMNGKNVI